MIDKKRYRPRTLRWFNRVLRWSLGGFVAHHFRIRAVGRELWKSVKPPFVLIPTHHGNLDPFMVNYFVPGQVYWVTSDGNMRSSIMKFLLSLVGSIPKSKFIPDLETIGWIVDVIRKRNGIVGIFAEGQASWDGHTQEIVPSTAKLIRLLKVPVVVALLKGSYYSQPRWAWNHRPSAMEIEFKLVLGADQARSMTPEQILASLSAAMEYDEEEWLANHPERWRGSGRARHLELSLYLCPVCGQAGTMRSSINRLYCRSCGHVVRLSRDYRFTAVGTSRPLFPSIRAWDQWQRGAFAEMLRSAAGRPEVPVFTDNGVLAMRGHRTNPLRRLRTGSLILYPDRIELATLFGERLRFPIAELEGAGVLKQQLLEFYQGKTLYQFRFPRRFQSARKWLDAITILKERLPA